MFIDQRAESRRVLLLRLLLKMLLFCDLDLLVWLSEDPTLVTATLEPSQPFLVHSSKLLGASIEDISIPSILCV
jgi:hypothetical protein